MSTLSMIDGVSKYNSTKSSSKAMIFSDQQVLDCDIYDGACAGGSPTYVIDFAATGLVQAANYTALTTTSTGRKGTCNKNAPIAWRLYSAGFADLTKGNLEADLKEIVYAYGPVTVAIDASDAALSAYKSGIYSPASGKCSSVPSMANHAIVS